MFEELFLRKRSSFIGIDIGSSAIQLVELVKNETGYQLNRFSVEFLPVGTIVNGNILKPEEVVATLEKIRNNLGIAKNTEVVIALNGPTVITKIVQFDEKLSEREMEVRAWLEMNKNFPQMSTMEMSLDFSILGKSEQSATMLDVLLVAAHVESVNSRIGVLNEAGFASKIVDVDYLALANASEFLFAQDETLSKDKVIAIFHLEYPVLILIVVRNFTIVYVRETSLERKEFSGKEENLLAKEKGTVDSTAEVKSSELQNSVHEKSNAIENSGLQEESELDDSFSSAKLISLIHQSLQFFYSIGSGGEINHILLTGDIKKAKENKTEIETKTGIKVIIANPFQKITLSKMVDTVKLEEMSSSLMVAFGLALRGDDYDTY